MTEDAWEPMEPEELQVELEALQAEFEEVKEKYAIVSGAASEWRAALRARTALIFHNNAGDVARMPVKLAHLIATKGALDCDVTAKAATVAFESGGVTLAEIPKSLFIVLAQVLDAWPWNQGKSESLSRDSHRNVG